MYCDELQKWVQKLTAYHLDKSHEMCENKLYPFGRCYGVKLMRLLKRAVAAAVCGIFMAGSCLSAVAEDNTRPETVVIDTGNTETSATDTGNTETSATDTGNTESTVIDAGKPETTVINPDDLSESQPESGLEVSAGKYQPIDLTDYIQWNGKTKLEAGKNYYIEGKVSPRMNVSVPKGTHLVLKEGSRLVVYKNRKFSVRGTVTTEPGAELMNSGKLTVYSGAGLENYGSLKGSVSSEYKIDGDFINRQEGKAIFSGIVNIYKNGVVLNFGQISLTSKAKMKVTGDFQTAEDGKLICAGYMAVTINGRTTQSGYFTLTGEAVNSGVFVFEKSVRYFKSKSAKFAVSKSSRLIDYRYNYKYDKPTGNDDSADNNGGEEHEQVTDVGIKGIDVSAYQGAIDWEKVKAAGIEFAIIRASRGSWNEANPCGEDRAFQRNITEAAKAGVHVGVYHYLYAETVEDARKEAKFFIETISPYQITYPVVLDAEEQSLADLGKKKTTAVIKAFLDELRDAGYYAMLYSNKAWLTYHIDVSKLSDYEIWLAQWNTVPTYKGEFGMWQYSSKGIVSGIDSYVDLDISYKDYAKIIRKGGYNHLS